MKNRLGMLLPLALVIALFAFASPAAAADPGWKGRPHVKAGAYSWVGEFSPTDTYSIAIVRGKNQRTTLQALGVVKRGLGRMTPAEAESQARVPDDFGFVTRSVVQVQRLGGAVVVYQPFGFRASSRLRQLSSDGLVAMFETTSELDSYVRVAQRGRLVRSFPVHAKPPKQGALPEEKGLGFGSRKSNLFATAWAFNERVSLIHVSRGWFDGRHPTYLLKGRAT